MDSRQNGRHQYPQQPPSSTGQQNNRFSWQTPPETPPEQAASLAVQTPQQNPPNNYYQPAVSPISPYQTSNSRLSQHPISPTTPIDPRPQSIFNPTVQPHQLNQPSYVEYPPEKTASPYNVPPPTQQHPALSAPISEPQKTHDRSRASLSRINTSFSAHQVPRMPPVPQSATSARTPASPLPQKTPITPSSPGPVPIKSAPDFAHPQSPHKSPYPESPYTPYTPYSPHGADIPVHGVFAPDAATGPNGLNPALHQPGQVAHPNMDMSGNGTQYEWKHSLCECGGDVGTCMTGLFCPCILYGKTAYRLSRKSEKKDPTDMLGYSAVNGHCGIMSAACGLWCLLPLIHRTRLRHVYKLTGSLFGDIGKSCCCCCCVAIQNEREIRDREENNRRWAGPATSEAYTTASPMVYAPPPRG